VLDTFKALAEPNRLHIVELLRAGPRPVGDMAIASVVSRKSPNTCAFSATLAWCKLASTRSVAFAPCGPAPLQQLDVWLKKYRQLWEQNFRRLDVLLDHLQAKESKSKRKR
jgi:DNA-binding transcriptional ArsR family regulator